MSGLIPVEVVMASLPKDQRIAIEALGAQLLAQVERRLTKTAPVAGSTPSIDR